MMDPSILGRANGQFCPPFGEFLGTCLTRSLQEWNPHKSLRSEINVCWNPPGGGCEIGIVGTLSPATLVCSGKPSVGRHNECDKVRESYGW